jgi:hypothetical protein
MLGVNEQPRHADKWDVRDWFYPYYCGFGRTGGVPHVKSPGRIIPKERGAPGRSLSA